MAKLSAATSLTLGVWAVLAVASLWSAPFGALFACLALLCSWAALHGETPPRWARRFAKTGATLSALALVGFAVLVALVPGA